MNTKFEKYVKLLGKRIKQARKDKGLTGEKLSEACFINATYLRQLEGGTRTPSLQVFILLCKELSVSPNYLLPELVAGTESEHIELLAELWEKASPDELRLISAMLHSALDTLETKSAP